VNVLQSNVRATADAILRANHEQTRLGQAMESGGQLAIDITTTEGLGDVVAYLLEEVRILEHLVKRLCTEIDQIKAPF
jgi:hypothetical protein